MVGPARHLPAIGFASGEAGGSLSLRRGVQRRRSRRVRAGCRAPSALRIMIKKTLTPSPIFHELLKH